MPKSTSKGKSSSSKKSNRSNGSERSSSVDEIEEEAIREEQELVFGADDQNDTLNSTVKSDKQVTLPSKAKLSPTIKSLVNSKSGNWNIEVCKQKASTEEEADRLVVDPTKPFKPVSSVAQSEYSAKLTKENISTVIKTPAPLADQVKDVQSRCCGLENLGLTCYINSVLQMLHGWPVFHSYMLTHGNLGMFHQVLSDLFDEMDTEASRKPGKAVVAPKEFLALFREVRPEFGAGQQQDAQEFLSVLLDLLHAEVNQASKLSTEKLAHLPRISSADQAWEFNVEHVDNSFYSKCIMGQVQSTLTCLDCGHQSHSWCCIWQLQVELGENCGPNSSESELKLKDCIEKYFSKETLTNDSAPYCTTCDKRKPAIKQQFLCRAPPFLIVHLKRFNADRSKNQRLVDIDRQVNISGQRYLLMSAVLHEGTETDGHYGTLRAAKSYGGNHWLALEDEKILPGECNDQLAALVMMKFAYLVLYAAAEPNEH